MSGRRDSACRITHRSTIKVGAGTSGRENKESGGLGGQVNIIYCGKD